MGLPVQSLGAPRPATDTPIGSLHGGSPRERCAVRDWDSNPHVRQGLQDTERLVPKRGVEPLRAFSPLDPESFFGVFDMVSKIKSLGKSMVLRFHDFNHFTVFYDLLAQN